MNERERGRVRCKKLVFAKGRKNNNCSGAITTRHSGYKMFAPTSLEISSTKLVVPPPHPKSSVILRLDPYTIGRSTSYHSYRVQEGI